MRIFSFAVLWLIATLELGTAQAQTRVLNPSEADQRVGVRDCRQSKPEDQNPGLVGPYEIQICFEAFVVSLKNKPATGPTWRIPVFVAHRIEPSKQNFELGNPRPSGWYTVNTLYREGLAATHRSYRFEMDEAQRAREDWYERGHLAAKNLIERVNADAAEFTHNTVNAVPQRRRFNRIGWLDLECRTGAWANQAQELWVITGPIFKSTPPQNILKAPLDPATNGTSAERRNRQPDVAIPDELFKIVVRKDDDSYRALAFVFPQKDASYGDPKRAQDPTKFLRSIALIEEQTGLVFFEGMTRAPQKTRPEKGLWPHKKDDFDEGCKDFAKDT
jgi:DNA/RNA endonuclease G (NUC1)